MCTGFSTARWALNSDMTYLSPNTRISYGRCRRCARSTLRYSGIGGNRASGPESRLPRLAAGAADASSAGDARISGTYAGPCSEGLIEFMSIDVGYKGPMASEPCIGVGQGCM
jgi:hypothetical protein